MHTTAYGNHHKMNNNIHNVNCNNDTSSCPLSTHSCSIARGTLTSSCSPAYRMLTMTLGVGTIINIFPILQMRKLRHRGVKVLVQSHTPRKWWSQNSNSKACAQTPLMISSHTFFHRCVLRLREAQGLPKCTQPANGWSQDPGSWLQILS